jgi:signal transduction histidine kinase
MGFRRSFERGLAWRTVVLLASLLLLIAALLAPDLRAARLLAALVAAGAIASLWEYIRRTNFLVTRFIESLRFEDYAQRFSDASGGGFDVLGDALDAALKHLQEQQVQSAHLSRYYEAIIDDSPSALLTIAEDGRVELLNKAARQLFRRTSVTKAEDLAQLGPEFMALTELPSGSQKITRLFIEGIPHRAIVSSAHVARLDGHVRVLSLLSAQSQLGELELSAQADLVRVLTHEILNSLTPVTSLARTASELVATASSDPRAMEDARAATETIARRAEGLSRFIESYRDFAKTPEVRTQEFLAKPWAEQFLPMLSNSAPAVRLEVEVTPQTLRMRADPDLVAHAVLNILRNAIRACNGVAEPHVHLRLRRAPQGGVLIEVADNGPGIPPQLRSDVFLPFYTTHTGGSGVGLSFARQVALAHGGLITVEQATGGGACFRLIL